MMCEIHPCPSWAGVTVTIVCSSAHSLVYVRIVPCCSIPLRAASIHVFRICMLLPGPWQRSVQNDESSKSCVAYSRGTESHRKHPRTWMREIVRPATTLPESPYTFEKVELAFSIRCVKADITNLHVPSGIIIPSTHHLSAPVRDSRTEDEGDKRGRKGAGSGDRSLYTYHHAVLPWHG